MGSIPSVVAVALGCIVRPASALMLLPPSQDANMSLWRTEDGRRIGKRLRRSQEREYIDSAGTRNTCIPFPCLEPQQEYPFWMLLRLLVWNYIICALYVGWHLLELIIVSHFVPLIMNPSLFCSFSNTSVKPYLYSPISRDQQMLSHLSRHVSLSAKYQAHMTWVRVSCGHAIAPWIHGG